MAARRIILGRLAAAAAGAALMGGCGTASGPTIGGAGRVPAGFTQYHGDGFSVAVPSGFSVTPYAFPGLPPGATTTVLTSGGVSPEKGNTQIFLLVNHNLQLTVDQVAANLRKADATNASVSDFHARVSTVTVAGARESRIVTESWVGKYSASRSASGAIHRTWLMVSPRPGTLIDVVVAVEPEIGGTLTASTVIDSFRLGR